MQSKKINELATNLTPSINDLTVVGDSTTGQLKKIALSQIAGLFGSSGTVSSIATTAPLTGGTITTSGTLGITQATTSTNGYLSSTDWNIFNGKQAALSGTGFIKISGTTISYDNSSYYLASNPNSFITLSSLSGNSGISYNNTTGVITSTITQYTDALARASLSFLAGNASYNSTTGVITIPTNNTQLTNGSNYIVLSSLSFAAGSGAYNNTTGVITIPTNNNQITNGSNYITLGSLSATSPIFYNSTTGVISSQAASASQNGYLTSTDWTTFNSKGSGSVTSVAMSVPTGLSITGSPITTSGTLAVTFTAGYSIPTNASQTTWDTAYTNRITSLTVTGSSGSATLVSNVLNIPTYTLAGLGGQPLATNLTSLAGLSYVSSSFVKMTAAGTFALDTSVYYLASNPSGFTSNVGTVTSVTGTAPVVSSGGTTPAISMAAASTSVSGYLSSTDWNTFNNKQNTISLTASRAVNTGTSGQLVANVTTATELAYLSGVTSNVQTQLDSKYSASNPSGYITGISSANVTSALGYTPYNSSNPAGYITSGSLGAYLPLSGGTISGNLTVNGSTNTPFRVTSTEPVVQIVSNGATNVAILAMYPSTGYDAAIGNFNGGATNIMASSVRVGQFRLTTVDFGGSKDLQIGTAENAANQGSISMYGSTYGNGYEGRLICLNSDGNTHFLHRNNATNFTDIGYWNNNGIYISYYGSYSDIRLKDVIETNPDINLDGLDLIKYTFKNNPSLIRYGYSAQQVQSILPDLVSLNKQIDGNDEDTTLMLNYNDLYAIKIAALEKRILQLENKLK
jgi:hypothetical protein